MISDDTNWETATVIDGYTLQSCRVTGEDSTIRVDFHVVGTMASSMNGSPDYLRGAKDEIAEFHVFKLMGKWKVVDLDQFRPHVSPEAAADSIDPGYGQRAKRAIASLKSEEGGDAP